MSNFAIAAFIQNEKLAGARIYNTDKGMYKDIKIEELTNLIKMEKLEIENLDIQNNELHWKQGVYSRYPCIFVDGHIENKDSATIAGIFDDKRYKIINYEGREAIVSLEKLVEYSKKYDITNCKISNKESKIVVQPISGKLPELSSKIQYLKVTNSYLRIRLPNDNSVTTLEIKNLINGYTYKNIQNIIVEPASAARCIKELILDTNYEYISIGDVRYLPNLERVIIKNPNAWIEADTFSDTAIKEVYAKGIYEIGARAFSNCKNLEHVIVQGSIQRIGAKAFEKCVKLDINEIVKKLDAAIQKGIFKGCYAKELHIGKNVTIFDVNMLAGIKDLEDLYIDNSALVIHRAMLLDVKRIHLYRNSEADRANIPDEVEKIYIEYSKEEQSKIARIGLAGLKTVNNSTYIRNNKAIRTVLMSRTDEEVRNFILDIFNHYNEYKGQIISNAISGYSLECKFPTYRIKKNLSKIEVVDNVILIYKTSSIYAIPTQKDLILELSKHYDNPRFSDEETFRLSSLLINNHGKIDNITYNIEARKMYFTFRNKKIISKSIDEVEMVID